MKRLLVLNGSFCEEPIIRKAKEMGYYVITTGNAPELIGHKSADEYIPCDYSDCEAVFKLVKEHNIDRVVSCANDFGVLTSSYVAEKMGWVGPDSYNNSLLLHHKDLFKEYCRTHDIPSPLSTIFTKQSDAEEYCKSVDYPIIVKANDLTGGKGIMKATNFEEAKIALENAFSMSRDKHILVEQFIVGSQHTFVAFVADKKIKCSASCNCYSPINPYLIQAETFPADNIAEHEAELRGLMLQICNDLDLRDGIFAFQYMMKDNKIFIIEMMRRPFGNQFLTLCGKVTGFNWEEGHIRSQLGIPCTDMECKEPEMKYCGHHGVMASKDGIVTGYEIPEDIEAHLWMKVDMIQPNCDLTIENHMKERVTYIYYKYDDRDEMNAAVAHFNDRIKVMMK